MYKRQPGNDSLKEEQYALQFYQRIRTAGSKWTHSLRAKYSNAFTEYMDPDFLNAYRRLHNTYELKDWYGSAGTMYQAGNNILLSTAADIRHNRLHRTDISSMEFDEPNRLHYNQHVTAEKNGEALWVSATVLFQHVHDQAPENSGIKNKKYWSPFLAASYALNSRIRLRAFYKHAVRIPTFNELYYTLVGNTALRPEVARQWNAGFTWSIPAASWKYMYFTGDLYYNRVKDKILALPRLNLFQWSLSLIHI